MSLFLAFVFFSFFLNIYRIETESMVSEIMPEDYVISRKIFLNAKLNVGEVLAFEYFQKGYNSIFIKRVVGIPRDTIFFRRNFIMINDSNIPHDSIFEMLVEESNHPDSTEIYNAALYSEYLLNRSNITDDQSKYVIENGNAIIVPENHYFMVGDNHYESMDSRFWGFIPKENIKGKVFWVF